MSENKMKSIHGEEYNILIERLRSIRKSLNITQVELSIRLGSDQSYISKYERCERRLDIIEVRSICLVLGITLQDFIKDFEKTLESRGFS